MTFCSNKTNDFLIKFDGLGAEVNTNSKQLFEIKSKCLKIQEKLNFLKKSHNENKQIKL